MACLHEGQPRTEGPSMRQMGTAFWRQALRSTQYWELAAITAERREAGERSTARLEAWSCNPAHGSDSEEPHDALNSRAMTHSKDNLDNGSKLETPIWLFKEPSTWLGMDGVSGLLGEMILFFLLIVHYLFFETGFHVSQADFELSMY